MKFILALLLSFHTVLWASAPSVTLQGDDGSTLLISFDSHGQVTSVDPSDGAILEPNSSSFLLTLHKYANHLSPLQQHISNYYNQGDIWSDLENIGKDWLPENVFFFFGFSTESIDTGTVGDFEFHDKVRFTAINGVLNDLQSARENAEMISNCTGRVRIHFVYRPSDGWPGDLFNALFTISGLTSPMAEHLAQKWRQLIEEMGGVNGGGRIIHYSHSLGSVDTIAARGLLLPEEAAMIDVYAFGSPRAIPPGKFHYAITYCTTRDQVWLLDPIGYYKYNVVFLPSDGLHGYDHRWNSDAHMRVLIELGEKWIHMHTANTDTKDMERNGVEPLTSTMPLLRSTN